MNNPRHPEAAPRGGLALVLHAHLPFVRHPEHPRFLEENWLFEAITETYLPLLQIMEGWWRDGLATRLTLTLSPTLCAMLRDPLLQDRYEQHLAGLLELAEKETHRTRWEPATLALAEMYLARFRGLQAYYEQLGRDVVGAFRRFQEQGRLEIITCAATHALLPLLAGHPPSLRAQILVARDDYRECFGCDPRGIWLPECAYTDAVEPALQEANLRWFVLDTHGVLNARPRPRYGIYAPVFTPNFLAAFGRDQAAARQVWSREAGYPGDQAYRDFYRDIGFDLDLEYLRPHLADPERRGFTGLKYHRISGGGRDKQVYDRPAALAKAAEHARHFVAARRDQLAELAAVMDRPPLVVAPYDAELFGHWWYEGPEFLDALVRAAVAEPEGLELLTPHEYLTRQPAQQVAEPSPSSWGAEGYWKVWLNETNAWIYPHLRVAQERMTELARRFPHAGGLTARALRQAGRELLLAQASDWPFILRTNTSPEYARRRVTEHLARFTALHDQLLANHVDAAALAAVEAQDNLFPHLDYRYWA